MAHFPGRSKGRQGHRMDGRPHAARIKVRGVVMTQVGEQVVVQPGLYRRGNVAPGANQVKARAV